MATNPCSLVRETCEWVVAQASSVTVDATAAERWVGGLRDEALEEMFCPKPFDADLHYVNLNNEELTAQYLLVVDSQNFKKSLSTGRYLLIMLLNVSDVSSIAYMPFNIFFNVISFHTSHHNIVCFFSNC